MTRTATVSLGPPDSLGAELVPARFFVLRTPLLPATDLRQWSDNLASERPLVGPSVAEDDWRERTTSLRQSLRMIFERPEVRHALFVASPSLEEAIPTWLKDPDGRKGRKVEHALVRYFGRMTTRCTPFGLFAGCSVGLVRTADCVSSRLVLSPTSRYRMVSRIDFGYLYELTLTLSRDPASVAYLSYSANTSLVRIGSSWHYTERRSTSGTSHHLSRLESDDFLDAVIEAASGPVTISELVRIVQQQDGGGSISYAEAYGYIADLISNDVLESTLVPAITGAPAAETVLAELNLHAESSQMGSTLERAVRVLRSIDLAGLGQPPSAYDAFAAALGQLPSSSQNALPIHVDMFKPADACIGEAVVLELCRVLEVLYRFGGFAEPDELQQFRVAFTERYERGWVPLLQALDEDSGIGFGKPGGPLGSRSMGTGTDADLGLTELELVLVQKLSTIGYAPGREIFLAESDLPVVADSSRALPSGCEVSATIVAASPAALERGDFEVLFKSAYGPPTARMLARFCHLDDELHALVREAVRDEESRDDGAVYAEVVHLPQGRVGNLIQRPVLREYEIPYLGRSGASSVNTLPPSDLLVTVGADGTILLFSKRLGRQVIPRLTNAHGFSNLTLSNVYRFLCYLQVQGTGTPPAFSWGRLDVLDYLPRVRAGRTVLARARWRLSTAELAELRKSSRYDRYVVTQRIRQARQLPRWIMLVERDNSLPIDLDNPLSVDAFVSAIGATGHVFLEEQYPSLADQCVAGPEGIFCNEIVLPFTRRDTQPGPRVSATPAVSLASIPVDSRVRLVPPGREWFYLKIYGGPVALETLLTTDLKPILADLFSHGLIDRWFFVRYQDPYTHLRLRVCAEKEFPHVMVAPRILSACEAHLSRGDVWTIQVDTYQREIERYGGVQGLELAENIFWADSEAVATLLPLLHEADEQKRWAVAILGVHGLLESMLPSADARRALLLQIRNEFREPAISDPVTTRRLATMFRQRRPMLVDFGRSQIATDSTVGAAVPVFLERERRIDRFMGGRDRLWEAGLFGRAPDEVIASIVHMHINRVYRSPDRMEELSVYDSLVRLNASAVMRMSDTTKGRHGNIGMR